METLKTSLKLTKTQANDYTAFLLRVIEDYQRGFFRFDIERVKENYNRDSLFRSIFVGAYGWFLNKNIPFAVVYEAVEQIVDKILDLEGYLK